MINGMTLILILLIFRSLMAMSLNAPLMVYIYLNLFAFLVLRITPKSRAKVCAQWRMSLSPPGGLLATDRSKAVVLV